VGKWKKGAEEEQRDKGRECTEAVEEQGIAGKWERNIRTV
jgi:hypothetical protein